jgi:hypothetical protein
MVYSWLRYGRTAKIVPSAAHSGLIEDELEDIRGVWSVGDQGAFTDELPIGENRGDASGLNVIVSEFRVPPQGLKRSGAINRGSQCRTRDMRSIPRHVGPCYVQ